MIQHIDHLGIAVKSLEESIPFYRDVLGLELEHQEEVESQKVRTAFLKCGEVHIELLEPTSDESPIAKFLATKGEGIHHVAYRTDDVQAQLDDASSKGMRLIHEKPFEGAGNKWVAFLHPKSSGSVLTEFCAPKD
jgi:methylmalonyl-CoA/ethylmalonyl-CoA epimerase